MNHQQITTASGSASCNEWSDGENSQTDLDGYSSSDMVNDSEKVLKRKRCEIVSKKKRCKVTDAFEDGDNCAYDDEINVEEEVTRLESTKSLSVTREYPDLIKLHPDALDAKDLVWVKRPTRKPQKLSPELSEGSKFINFSENSTPIEMFIEYWNKPLEVVLKGMNDKSKELFEEGKLKCKNLEEYTREDILAFTAAWLIMDCTPYRNRKEFWNTDRYR